MKGYRKKPYLIILYISFVLSMFEQTLSANKKPSVVPKTKSSSSKVSSNYDIRKFHKNIKTYNAMTLSFKQTTYRKLRKKTSISLGSAYFIRPNKFLWSYRKPTKDFWIFDGKRFLSWTYGDTYALEYAVDTSKGKELYQVVNMILNFNSLTTSYKAHSLKETLDKVSLKLLPKERNKNFFNHITEISINLKKDPKDKKYEIQYIKLSFLQGNYSEFDFSNIKQSKVDLTRLQLPKKVIVQKAM